MADGIFASIFGLISAPGSGEILRIWSAINGVASRANALEAVLDGVFRKNHPEVAQKVARLLKEYKNGSGLRNDVAHGVVTEFRFTWFDHANGGLPVHVDDGFQLVPSMFHRKNRGWPEAGADRLFYRYDSHCILDIARRFEKLAIGASSVLAEVIQVQQVRRT
jgi:hypothetical protein